MKHVFVDFEMNVIDWEYWEQRQICGTEIMEVGAVMLDEDDVEISQLQEFVKPVYNTEVVEHCSKVTGITMEHLADAKTFDEVFYHFLEWCEENSGGEYEVYAWSENDLIQLKGELVLKDIVIGERVQYMIDGWKDFQKEFCELIGFKKVLSLEAALDSIGEQFSGTKHRALDDARNTAKIFSFTRSAEFDVKMKNVIDALKPAATLSCKLGDLFNLSSLMFALE